jgi:hypothetical protein
MTKRKPFVLKKYCLLCTEKELELYGNLRAGMLKHHRACREAGCKHPPVVRLPDEVVARLFPKAAA